MRDADKSSISLAVDVAGKRVIVARVQLFSFLVPLLRCSSELVQFSMIRVFSPFCKCNHASDEWSNLSCPSSPRSVASVESNLPNEQCHGEIVEANQITPRSKKIDGGSLALSLARTGDPFWPAAAARGTDRRTCQSGLALSPASEGGFNFRRVMRSIKPCKRICLSALLQNGAGLLCL